MPVGNLMGVLPSLTVASVELARPIDCLLTLLVGSVTTIVCAVALRAPESRVGRFMWRWFVWRWTLLSPWVNMVLVLVMGVILTLMGLLCLTS